MCVCASMKAAKPLHIVLATNPNPTRARGYPLNINPKPDPKPDSISGPAGSGRVADLYFGPGDCSVTLRPRMGYVPKSLSTPFKIQTVSLSALSSESAASSEADAQTSVCPVRALRIYIDRLASFRQSNQLFVCYGGCARGRAVSKQRLSHWIVDAITAAYTNQGLECPLHIRGHSTRAMASSWAWSRGMSIQDICVAAGWSSENTFARFYRLDVQSFASQVLSVSG